MQSKDVNIGEKWLRHEISLRSDISLQPLEVFFISQELFGGSVDVAIAFPQCEEGLFATSVIPPDTPLPAIANGPSDGPMRAAEQVWIDGERFGGPFDSNSATVVFVGVPIPEAHQVMEDQFLTCFSLWSESKRKEVMVGISGKFGARFCLKVNEGKQEEEFVSDIIAGHQRYFVSAVFDSNKISVIVNGLIAIVCEINDSLVFERFYIGSSHETGGGAFNGHVERFMVYAVPLLYPRILELYQDVCPAGFQYTYKYMLNYFRYSLVDDSEVAVINSCYADEGFSYFINQLKFALPAIYEQFPPGHHFTEDNVRDWVAAIMRRPGVRASREAYSKIGRTDLSLSYSYLNRQEPIDLVENVYRIEFKIWGRDGYKEAPSQPLKYMQEGELVGAFVMLDRRVGANMEDFEKIIQENKEFPCISVREIPVIETNIRYFISFHVDNRYRMVRMMINFFMPIPA